MLEVPEALAPDNGTVREIVGTHPTLGNQQERLVRCARLATVIDCEGFITIRTIQRSRIRPLDIYPVVRVTNTDAAMINFVADCVEALGIGRYVWWGKPTGFGKRPMGMVAIEGLKRASALIPHIRPFLITKARQADLVMEFSNLRKLAWTGDSRRRVYSERELEIANAVRSLQTKGAGWRPVSSTSKRDATEQLGVKLGRPMMCSDLTAKA